MHMYVLLGDRIFEEGTRDGELVAKAQGVAPTDDKILL